MLRVSGLLLALALAGRSASAQIPVLPTRPTVDTAPAAPAQATSIIEAIDIPLRASSTLARIGAINALLRPTPDLLEAQRLSVALVDSLRILTDMQATVPSAQLTRRALTSLASEWNRWELIVEDLTRLVRRRTAELDSLRLELNDSQALWQRTATRARIDTVTEVIAEAESMERRLGAVRGDVRAHLQELLATEVVLTKAAETIDAGLAGVATAFADMRQQMLRIESPSLWSAMAAGDWPGLVPTIGSRWNASAAAFSRFVDVYRARLLAHLLATLVLFLIIVNLRRDISRLEATMATASARDSLRVTPDARWVLANPGGSTILVGALLTVGLYPTAPLVVYDLAIIVAALSVLRLMPTFLPAGIVRHARWSFALLALDRFGVVLLFATPWHRIAALAVSFAAIAIAVSGWRHVQGLDEHTRRLTSVRWGERGAVVAGVLAVASVPANLVGNVSLTLLFTSSVAMLATLAILCLAAAKAIDGLFTLAILAASDDVKLLARKGPQLVLTISKLVRVVAVASWLAAGLFLFLLWDPLGRLVSDVLASGVTIGQSELTVARILTFFGIIWLGAVMGRWIALLLETDVLDRLTLPHGMSVTIATIVQYALTAIAFFLALAATGVNIGQLTIIGGALSVGVGFGLQTIVNNFISGLILAFERPVSIGDTIQLADLEGVVTKIGIRASVIRATTGAEVIVPNGRLLDRDLINWTRSDRSRRLEIAVQVQYGADPHATAILLPKIAAGVRDVSRTPAPTCLFTGYGHSSTDFVLRVWTEAYDYRAVGSDIRLALDEAFKGAGLESPYQQHDLHLRSVSAEVVAALSREPAAPRPPKDSAQPTSEP